MNVDPIGNGWRLNTISPAPTAWRRTQQQQQLKLCATLTANTILVMRHSNYATTFNLMIGTLLLIRALELDQVLVLIMCFPS